MVKIVSQSATLIEHTSNPEQLIERAGRVCYKSEDEITEDSAGAFIRMLIKWGHHAVIEHASATVKFICDRGVSHEMVGHRLVSYCQESTRFCNYSIEIKFGSEITVIRPPGLAAGTSTGVSWLQAMNGAEHAYLSLSRQNVPPEIARSVLPTCLKTEVVMTCNLREWHHVFSLRCSLKAHPQIREIMLSALEQLYGIAPAVFEDLARDYGVAQTQETSEA